MKHDIFKGGNVWFSGNKKKCNHNKTSDMLIVVNQRKMCVAWKSFLCTESSEVVPKPTRTQTDQ